MNEKTTPNPTSSMPNQPQGMPAAQPTPQKAETDDTAPKIEPVAAPATKS